MKVITITSPSSAGKDTILNEVVKTNDNITSITSMTSRPMREGETQDKQYHFRSYEEMKTMIENNEFIEHKVYKVANGEEWLYGVHKSEIDKNKDETKIVIVDYNGLKELRAYCENNGIDIISYYIECNPRERLLRSLNREVNANSDIVKEMCRRLLDDELNVVPARDICIVVKNESKQDYIDAIIKISGDK
jgi:guanylate kinase